MEQTVKKYIFCFVELFLKVGQGWSIGMIPRILILSQGNLKQMKI
jgi:hypothetical protein